MQSIFRQIWQWLKRLFERLLGGKSSQTAFRTDRRLRQENSQLVSATLTDTDYEFLFSELLEGVAHGWHEGRILKFFEKLGDRGKPSGWVAWLERFGARVLASPAPNHQLAARMMRLGELAQSFPAIREIGHTSYSIGRQLFTRDSQTAIWEYEGPDAEEIAAPASPVEVAIETEEMESQESDFDEVIAGSQRSGGTPILGSPQVESTRSWGFPPGAIDVEEVPFGSTDDPADSNSASQAEGVETLTLEELFARLQQDANLAELMAQQLGIETSDPQVIIETLLNQYNQTRGDDNQPIPNTLEDWFNRGLQQANLGDLEGAIAAWDEALKLNPNLPQVWQNRGSALGQLGRLEEAIASFDKALELQPDDYQIWNNRGSALYHLQRWEEALASWDKVLELQSDYYQAWYNRGCALENLGRVEDAIASYTQALSLQPDFELAQSKLSDLRRS